MDKGRKKPMREANLNTTVIIRPSSSKQRSKLNETVSVVKGVVKSLPDDGRFGSAPKLKQSSLKNVSQLKLDLVYNEYLRALLKQSIVQRQVKENKTVLDRQLQYYSELLNQKQQALKEVHKQTELIKKQSEIVEVLKLLEEKLERTKTFFVCHQVSSHMDTIKMILEKECDKVFLKNVKLISTRDDYNQFLETLKSLKSTTDKIMNSGVDFEEIHNYAEQIRNFLELQLGIRISQNEMKQIETDEIGTLLKKLSDMFAKQYENKPNNLSDKF